jgi:hypothetical protein
MMLSGTVQLKAKLAQLLVTEVRNLSVSCTQAIGGIPRTFLCPLSHPASPLVAATAPVWWVRNLNPACPRQHPLSSHLDGGGSRTL